MSFYPPVNSRYAPVAVFLISLASFACTPPSATDETGTTGLDEAGDENETGGESEAGDGDSASGDNTGETGGDCPAPTVEPRVEDNPDFFCPEGFGFDASYRLCVDGENAVGPFPPQMVEACFACGGVACEDTRWPEDQARGLRGVADCWPGTQSLDPICVDNEFAWGPFSPSMVADCKDAGGGDVTCETMRYDRDFAQALLPPVFAGDWGWILPVDYGLRDDSAGGGAFSALRLNNPGGHSGLDILAAVGTELYAPCEGPVYAGTAGGYGNFVQLFCPLPASLVDDEQLWASIFYAHLDSLSVNWGDNVTAGQQVGTVGKTGNAGASSINPHVHFEVAVHSSLAAAQSEAHVSSNHHGNSAGDTLAAKFEANCLESTGFTTDTGPLMKGRRPDPFVLLTCLSKDKPALEAPPTSLQSSPTPWSAHYSARSFDVDEGIP